MISVPNATPILVIEDEPGDAGDEPFPWEGLVSRILHPIQVVILESLIRTGLPVSPVDVVRMCEGTFELSLVGYHVRALAKLGVIEVAGEEPVRGTFRHLYALVPESRWP